MQIKKVELANFAQVTQSCISKWIRVGLPVEENGLIDTHKFLCWHYDYRKQYLDPNHPDALQTKTRLWNAQADKTEIEIQLLRRQLYEPGTTRNIKSFIMTTNDPKRTLQIYINNAMPMQKCIVLVV